MLVISLDLIGHKFLVIGRLSKSRSKSRFFKENQTESISRFFGASVTRFQYCITLEGLTISAGGHRMGFTPPQVRSRRVWRSLYLCESHHAKCTGVYIFNSKYWGKKI